MPRNKAPRWNRVANPEGMTPDEARKYYASENEERAGRVADLLRQEYDGGKDSWETALTDLLADCRHFCDTYGYMEFAEVDRRGHEHYTAEVVQARTGVGQ